MRIDSYLHLYEAKFLNTNIAHIGMLYMSFEVVHGIEINKKCGAVQKLKKKKYSKYFSDWKFGKSCLFGLNSDKFPIYQIESR